MSRPPLNCRRIDERMNVLDRLRKEEEGQDLVEYALVIALLDRLAHATHSELADRIRIFFGRRIELPIGWMASDEVIARRCGPGPCPFAPLGADARLRRRRLEVGRSGGSVDGMEADADGSTFRPHHLGNCGCGAGDRHQESEDDNWKRVCSREGPPSVRATPESTSLTRQSDTRQAAIRNGCCGGNGVLVCDGSLAALGRGCI